MIPKECKRLAEVEFPIATVSKHAAREKSIRHGHPSTLHLWWARRPLASSRAMLLALLLPDPGDSQCPAEFKQQARTLLAKLYTKIGNDNDDIALRKALLKFIGEFANWNLANEPTYLDIGRKLVHIAHPEEPPLIVDPFSGGGSIPLEALRLGAEAFASDLNPVACLILKTMLEDIPRHGPDLADELRRVGADIKQAAEQELAAYYPPDPDGARPIAYLWARTVQCESPDCGAEIPLMRSFWLSKKTTRKRALRYTVVAPAGDVAPASSRTPPIDTHSPPTFVPPHIAFEIFTPTNDNDSDIPAGTVSRARATCPCCGSALPPERVKQQLAAQRGGADVIFDAQGNRSGGATMLAVVTIKPGEQGRHYRLPTPKDYHAVWQAQQKLAQVAATPLPNGLSAVPDEPLPPIGTLGFRIQRYGMMQWGDLFTARQTLALENLTHQIQQAPYAHLKTALAIVIGRCVDYWSSGAMWAQEGEFVAHTFGRHALPLVWDFVEAVPWTTSSGNFEGAVEWVSLVIEAWKEKKPVGQVQQADACESPLPNESATVWFTDPPYYDAIPYSDLSDFFFVWLKRTLPGHPLLRDPFDPNNPLTPKEREAVQDETKLVNGHPKDRAWFEATMAKAFAEGRRVLVDNGIGCVVFAHKTTEGWEALLSGMIQGGWVITGSWPISTERPGRMRAQESAALATSVHLVCRPRPAGAGRGDWADVLHALPKRIGDWVEHLQREGIRGGDLVFACIGPALEIYSRYDVVADAEDHIIPLGGDPTAKEAYKRGFLSYVWELVARTALEQILGTAEAKARNGAAGAVEEDARLTALFLWTLQSTDTQHDEPPEDTADDDADDDDADDDDTDEQRPRKPTSSGFTLIFDVVRRFAQPLGIHLPAWEGRIIQTKKGIVSLMPITARANILFGEKGANAIANYLTEESSDVGQMLLPGLHDESAAKGRSRRSKAKPRNEQSSGVSDEDLEMQREATTLDRVHAAMLFQKGGYSRALWELAKTEKERGSGFLRLANALSALYPRGSEEKRLLDAMLLGIKD